tara:strand:- start:472 stop:915 length:444 start_codon:yes stop_codon:yes gene_type:complete
MISGLVLKGFIGGAFSALKGFLKVVWEALCVTLKIPLGIILVVFIIGYVYNKHSVSKAITELVAGSELKAQSTIIKNQEKILSNKEKLLAEKEEIIRKNQKALEEFEKEKEAIEKQLSTARSRLDEIKNSDTGEPAPADYFDGLLNK